MAAAAAPKTANGDESGIDNAPGWLENAYHQAKQNPELLAFKIETNAYKFSWLLIPISVPFVWILFLHRRRYGQYRAYDHTVFVTYSLSFMTLMLVAASLLRAVLLPEGAVALACTLIPPVHMYRQLRGAYGLSWFSALWRTVLLVWFAGIALTLFLLVLVALGVME